MENKNQMIRVPQSGDPNTATILIVGEAPGREEEVFLKPFIGGPGQELRRMLEEAGIDISSCLITNVCPFRPPANEISSFFFNKTEAKKNGVVEFNGRYPNLIIHAGIKELKILISSMPNLKLILCFGETALWALTGRTGIGSWHGSYFEYEKEKKPIPLLATYHPAAVLRMWNLRWQVVHDLKKGKRWIEDNLFPFPFARQAILNPPFSLAKETLESLLLKAGEVGSSFLLSVDIETIKPFISCIGIASSETKAIVIPLISSSSPRAPLSQYSDDERAELMLLIRELLSHPAVDLVGQNFSYDLQYLCRDLCLESYNYSWDTMIAHHTKFPMFPKGLDDLATFYLPCHVFWKHEGKSWEFGQVPDEQLWLYNAKDACITFAIAKQQMKEIGTTPAFLEQMKIAKQALAATFRGVRIDQEKRIKFLDSIFEANQKFENYFNSLVPPSVFPHQKTPFFRSPKQLGQLLYETLHQRPNYGDSGSYTADDAALLSVAKREPLLAPLCHGILRYRSLENSFKVLSRNVDPDLRMRCLYDTTGTYTFRLASRESAFGSGTNLQNLTKGEPEYRNQYDLPSDIALPNIRRIFVPDPRKLLLDCDLARADAQAVAGYADDREMIEAFQTDADMHLYNAVTFYDLPVPLDETRESHPNYPIHKEKYGKHRHQMKGGVHATNYGVQSRTLSGSLGCTVHEADRFIVRWFSLHPKIKLWQEDVDFKLACDKTLTNVWGYECMFPMRSGVDLMQKGLAWLGQSTIALYINKIWLEIIHTLPWVEDLMQVHDSLVLQIPKERWKDRHLISEAASIPIPFAFPFVIRLGIAYSSSSWGDVKETTWR